VNPALDASTAFSLYLSRAVLKNRKTLLCAGIVSIDGDIQAVTSSWSHFTGLKLLDQ
jgi:hypothetical protein